MTNITFLSNAPILVESNGKKNNSGPLINW
jgi:hypothetical protein